MMCACIYIHIKSSTKGTYISRHLLTLHVIPDLIWDLQKIVVLAIFQAGVVDPRSSLG